jgi:predicted RNA binding protein YcfA (HicA-like mRNA interferase family)
LKTPRDLSGQQLAAMLRKFGYQIVRTSGSHMRLVSHLGDREHFVTIPAHSVLKVGTLNAILAEIATYLGMERSELNKQLFDR